MSDIEIRDYLIKENFKVNAQDFIIKVLNTSHQIINEIYNFNTQMMTIVTPDNSFSFKWNLEKN